MDNTEFEIADPAPPGKRTDGNHDLSQQHKHDEGEMEYHREISCESIEKLSIVEIHVRTCYGPKSNYVSQRSFVLSQ